MDQIINSIRNDSYIYKSEDRKFWNDKEFVLKALKIRGGYFGYTSSKLQIDKDVILEAVKKNGFVMNLTSKTFQNNNKLIVIALKSLYFIDYIEVKKDGYKFGYYTSFRRSLLKKSFNKILELY